MRRYKTYLHFWIVMDLIPAEFDSTWVSGRIIIISPLLLRLIIICTLWTKRSTIYLKTNHLIQSFRNKKPFILLKECLLIFLSFFYSYWRQNDLKPGSIPTFVGTHLYIHFCCVYGKKFVVVAFLFLLSAKVFWAFWVLIKSKYNRQKICTVP